MAPSRSYTKENREFITSEYGILVWSALEEPKFTAKHAVCERARARKPPRKPGAVKSRRPERRSVLPLYADPFTDAIILIERGSPREYGKPVRRAGIHDASHARFENAIWLSRETYQRD